MNHRLLKGTEEEISRSVRVYAFFRQLRKRAKLTKREAQKIVDYAYGHGVNYF